MNCCFSSKHHQIETIAAGETFRYRVELLIAGKGEFESGILLHLEDKVLRTIPVVVRGVCTGEGHDPP